MHTMRDVRTSRIPARYGGELDILTETNRTKMYKYSAEALPFSSMKTNDHKAMRCSQIHENGNWKSHKAIVAYIIGHFEKKTVDRK